MHLERDLILDRLHRADQCLVARLTHLVTGEGRGLKSALDQVRAGVLARSAAEDAVLFPAFSRLTLRLDVERLLADCRTNHQVQEQALHGLQQTRRKHPLWKLRALALREVVVGHRAHIDTVLVPTLRSQLPQALYQSILAAYTTQCLGVAGASARSAHAAPRAA